MSPGVYRVAVPIPELCAAAGAILLRRPNSEDAFVVQRILINHARIALLEAAGAIVPEAEQSPHAEQWGAVAERAVEPRDKSPTRSRSIRPIMRGPLALVVDRPKKRKPRL